ncbi:MAG: CubicO group peptidase (beta-lactamase class C family) [Pseudohongiellaceae bacterium]|jgi:CubicO group peptidase (beta-lactamase class C family)
MKTRTKQTLLAITIVIGVAGVLISFWQGKQIDKIIALMDFDGNGMLQIEEVLPSIRLRFSVLDTDGSGDMDRKEIGSYLRHSIFSGIVRKWHTNGLPEYPPAGDIDLDALQVALDEMVEVLELPGAVMLVGKNGVERNRIMSGELDANTVVPVASASKWVSSVVLMRLVELDILELDAPLKRYMPKLAEHWANTTLRQLLSHSSGTGEGHAVENIPSMAYREQFERLIQKPVDNVAGVEFTYGGISMQIAGYIAEQVSNKPWSQLFDELVGAPSGMEQSAYGHPFWYRTGTVINSPNIAGGLHTSAQDYFNFLTALYPGVAGVHLLTEDSIGQMESDQTSRLTQNFRPPMVPNDWFYGLGLWCENPIERRCMLVNSAGAFGTFPWIDRTSGTYGVLITLGNMPEILPFALNLRRLAIELER